MHHMEILQDVLFGFIWKPPLRWDTQSISVERAGRDRISLGTSVGEKDWPFHALVNSIDNRHVNMFGVGLFFLPYAELHANHNFAIAVFAVGRGRGVHS